jgi:hypothetical protein
VEGAIERIVRMLTAAHISARVARNDADQRTIYQQRFSDIPLAQLATVQRIIDLMLSRMTTGALDFHYVPTLAAFNSLGVGPLPAGVKIDNIEAFVIQHAMNADTYRAYCQGFDILSQVTMLHATIATVHCPVCNATFLSIVKLMKHRTEARH